MHHAAYLTFPLACDSTNFVVERVDLMTEFMRRWRAREPRAKAWREAQLALLRTKDYSNPYYWAAFTLTGRWN